MIQYIQLLILVILLDRNLLIRDRYIFGIYHRKPNGYVQGCWSLWIYKKKTIEEPYYRHKMLFEIKYGHKPTFDEIMGFKPRPEKKTKA